MSLTLGTPVLSDGVTLTGLAITSSVTVPGTSKSFSLTAVYLTSDVGGAEYVAPFESRGDEERRRRVEFVEDSRRRIFGDVERRRRVETTEERRRR
jgi:hypothetical protein